MFSSKQSTFSSKHSLVRRSVWAAQNRLERAWVIRLAQACAKRMEKT